MSDGTCINCGQEGNWCRCSEEEMTEELGDCKACGGTGNLSDQLAVQGGYAESGDRKTIGGPCSVCRGTKMQSKELGADEISKEDDLIECPNCKGNCCHPFDPLFPCELCMGLGKVSTKPPELPDNWFS